VDPFNKDRNRRRKNPFDFIDDEEFDKIFDEMQKMFDNIDFKEMIEDMLRSGFDPNKRFIHGFSLNIGSDGKPKFQEFGNRSIKSPTGEPILSEEREPLTDIIEGDEDVAVTVEIPGVEKEDIDLNITEKKLEIRVNNPKRKYHKIVNIPCNVKPKTTKATYKNGVLDIVIKRAQKKKPGEGHRVNID
jgi:HSP20 family protein